MFISRKFGRAKLVVFGGLISLLGGLSLDDMKPRGEAPFRTHLSCKDNISCMKTAALELYTV